MLHQDAHAAALDVYRRALASGADNETALTVALAKLRASIPAASEWELRTIFVKLLAAERQRTATERSEL